MIPSQLSREDFIARFGPVYEASSWVAEAVWPAVARGDLDSLSALAAAMRRAVDAAPRARRLALIKAHPQLAVSGPMAEASVREQQCAGLDQCSSEELDQFQRLNASYLDRFGHPFIVAVKGLSRADILNAFEARVDNEPEAEFETAMDQIHRIAGFRLAALFAA